MTFEERKEYAKHRITSAHKTLGAARVLADHGYWNSALNRLYYAVFYAVNALLVLNNIKTKSHTAVKSQFSWHFVKTGEIDKKHGKLFAQLFDLRQKGDYENLIEYGSDDVKPFFEPAEEMINLIDKKIHREF